MIEDTIERWHRHLRGDLPGGLDELLDDDVVFYSPVVFTPQRGREVTKLYLLAAGASLGGGSDDADSDADAGPGPAEGAGGFRYTKTVMSGDVAVLEFETTVGGKYVNGVDIIRVGDHGRIVEFRVMIRPLQAVDAVHQVMKAALDA
jgi:hypothetical protein